MKFEFLPHTADIRMKIVGETLPLLFKAGMRGMAQIQREDHCQTSKNDISNITTIEAADVTCLLIDFLSEVLSYSYTEKVVYCELALMEFSERLLIAQISGSKIEKLSEEIKAVTYHEAEIKRNKAGLWETIVVFDI